jgi:hypothetical protein
MKTEARIPGLTHARKGAHQRFSKARKTSADTTRAEHTMNPRRANTDVGACMKLPEKTITGAILNMIRALIRS